MNVAAMEPETSKMMDLDAAYAFLDTICRLCANVTGKLHNVHTDVLPEENGVKATTLPALINSLLHQVVAADDHLPKHICSKCVQSLKQFREFRANCDVSHGTLLHFVWTNIMSHLGKPVHSPEQLNLSNSQNGGCMDDSQPAAGKPSSVPSGLGHFDGLMPAIQPSTAVAESVTSVNNSATIFTYLRKREKQIKSPMLRDNERLHQLKLKQMEDLTRLESTLKQLRKAFDLELTKMKTLIQVSDSELSGLRNLKEIEKRLETEQEEQEARLTATLALIRVAREKTAQARAGQLRAMEMKRAAGLPLPNQPAGKKRKKKRPRNAVRQLVHYSKTLDRRAMAAKDQATIMQTGETGGSSGNCDKC